MQVKKIKAVASDLLVKNRSNRELLQEFAYW